MLDAYGPGRFHDRLCHAGARFSFKGKPNLSMALGGASTSLESLVTLYTALGRGGPRRHSQAGPAGTGAGALSHEPGRSLYYPGYPVPTSAWKTRSGPVVRGALHGVENRYQLRVQRCLGHWAERRLHRGRVGGSAGWLLFTGAVRGGYSPSFALPGHGEFEHLSQPQKTTPKRDKRDHLLAFGACRVPDQGKGKRGLRPTVRSLDP